MNQIFLPAIQIQLPYRHKKKAFENIFVRITAAAVEVTLWPETYSGKGGVCKRGRQCGSTKRFITVSGRTLLCGISHPSKQYLHQQFLCLQMHGPILFFQD